ncbi:MAG: glycoside hydrolase family 3 C-terminal domain-containing protein [Erysipelotrichaceae bacterium]|nr:glycoside hydrolase family 3 C-terminal domain-containing protein [Erysipelotrichaceae bacterium]
MDKKALKREKKAQKKAYKKARAKYIQPWKVLCILSMIVALVATPLSIVLGMFDNVLVLFTGGTFWEVVNEDPNAQYFTSEFTEDSQRIESGAKLGYQMEAEGAALLMNENDTLPLSAGSKVSLFSISSVNPVYGGTGSGNVDASKAVNLKDSLTNSGLSVNSTLWDWYASEEISTMYGRKGAAGGQVQDSAGYDLMAPGSGINEVPWNVYPEEVLNSVSEYGDAAIAIFSRIGGEGADCEFQSTNYLALEPNEVEMLTQLKALKDAGTVKKIIVLINTSNALQVDFLKDNKYDVDSVLWIGGVGGYGLEAVADILAGHVNPSGSLADTYLYNNYSSPAMQNFIPTVYEGWEDKIPSSAKSYMIYQEGIYVGHKYFETRYEDYVMGTGNAGNYVYDDCVAFPFGYGLSYTTFEYSNMTSVYNAAKDAFEVSVTVTNTGDVAGKETVQIYLNSPYTEYDIENKVEKASASLVGFEKTDILQPGESETVKVTVDRREFASFDTYGYGTYIMDAGDYLLTAATDAHNAVNNFLAHKGYTVENTNGKMDVDGNAALVTVYNNPEMDAKTYAVTDDGDAITTQLSIADPNLNEGVEESVTWLSRNDWTGTFPTEIVKFTLTESLIAALQEILYNPEDHEQIEVPTLGADNGMKLVDMIGKDYDDPAWDALLDQLTYDEMVSLIADSFHWTMPVESVQAPGSRDENGPQGLTVTLFGAGLSVDETTALTSEDVMAATFNKELVYEIGKIIGEDCLAGKVAILYGPGANIHRTPYSGRNFEYYSEDAFLSYEIGKHEVMGIQEKGVHVVMKHFALNDCEQDRLGQAAWLTEQAAREIYLKAFQGALEDEVGNGVMFAYTRWGTQWSGSVEGLNHIMRTEWNNNGLNITDNVLTGYVNSLDGIFGAMTTCDSMLAFMPIGNLQGFENDGAVVDAMKEACHHNLYAIANSLAMNGIGPDSQIKATTPSLIATLQMVRNISLVVFVVTAALWTVRGSQFKKTEASKNYKEFKKSLKANKA